MSCDCCQNPACESAGYAENMSAARCSVCGMHLCVRCLTRTGQHLTGVKAWCPEHWESEGRAEAEATKAAEEQAARDVEMIESIKRRSLNNRLGVAALLATAIPPETPRGAAKYVPTKGPSSKKGAKNAKRRQMAKASRRKNRRK